MGSSRGREEQRESGADRPETLALAVRRRRPARREAPAGGGTRAFGYAADGVTVRPDEAEAIRDAVERVLRGDSLRSIAIDFERDGISTIGGKPWTTQALRKMLISPRIAGQRAHHAEVFKAVWDGVISPDTSLKLRAILTDPQRRTVRAPWRAILRGLLVCGRCGERLRSRSAKADRGRAYGCIKGPGFTGCGRLTIAAVSLERSITEAMLEALDNRELAAKISAPLSGGSSTIDVEAERCRMDELADAYAAGELTMREWRRARDGLETRIKAAERQLADSAARRPSPSTSDAQMCCGPPGQSFPWSGRWRSSQP